MENHGGTGLMKLSIAYGWEQWRETLFRLFRLRAKVLCFEQPFNEDKPPLIIIWLVVSGVPIFNNENTDDTVYFLQWLQIWGLFFHQAALGRHDSDWWCAYWTGPVPDLEPFFTGSFPCELWEVPATLVLGWSPWIVWTPLGSCQFGRWFQPVDLMCRKLCRCI